jgi:outer membrane protein OmpA-like peptidoglycan-associated protein
MQRRTLLKHSAGAGLTALALLVGGVAYAEDDITPLDPNITPLDPNIEPFDDVRAEGDSTTITLSSDVLFEFGKSEVGDAAADKITGLVKDVPKGATVSIDGYTDNIPFERGNDVLSKERAQAVADVIAKSRPDLDLTVTGHGEDDPVAPNESGGKDHPEGRAKNRRVEIRYDG